ncbi:hypothetical protein L1987_12565 [Smallanthus sonchifolius]|uniref:Uncharacterized protein n=1 Tax=Smallanthus sonchifolius TaxID=185202 RepID=A0ACB9JGG5_9ASTR|nr:hypothetical protein L1987_12565 [Smallanthus sonchifolius]
MATRRPPEGVWQDPRRKMKEGNRSGRWTSYYVANLPEGTKPEDLKTCFNQFGNVVDIYVASRKDKSGSCFGFVRFSMVEDKWELERSMREINMKNLRLSVNLAKYDRDGNPNAREEKKTQAKEAKQYGSSGGAEDTRDKPFLRALLRNKRQGPVITVPEVADYDVLQWYDLSVMGKAKDLLQLCSLHESLCKEGWEELKIKYLGGLHVLLTFKKYSDANEFVENKLKWSNGFSMICKTKVTKDDSGQEEGSGRQEGTEESEFRSSGPSPAKAFPMHGESKESGMGMSIDAPGTNLIKPSIPDLNSSMGVSVNEVTGDRRGIDSDQIAKPSVDSQTGNGGDACISEEMEATMEVGQVLGVDLRNKADLVRSAILGERVRNGCP